MDSESTTPVRQAAYEFFDTVGMTQDAVSDDSYAGSGPRDTDSGTSCEQTSERS